ncbi:MAG TPA: hypothetical protein VN699_03520, partial [Pirellulales bacterium]|nr:hypothetical protein [Pirellulales bacterium]
MATLRGALAGLVATLFACGVFADDDVPLVKGAGDLDQLEVRGAAAFDEAEIKAALAADIDVVVATRADAPRAALEKVLGEKTLDGYLAAGYADAKA